MWMKHGVCVKTDLWCIPLFLPVTAVKKCEGKLVDNSLTIVPFAGKCRQRG